MDKIESEVIRAALLENGCILKRTAQALRIDRKTLGKKVKHSPELQALVNSTEDRQANRSAMKNE